TESIPRTFHYSGDLDWDGEPYTGDLTMRFALYPDPEAVEPLWDETQPITARRGRFAAELGTVTPIEDVILDAGPLYLGVQVQRPTDPEFIALGNRQKLNPVPYALHSSNAANLNVAGDLSVQGDLRLGTSSRIDSFAVVGPWNLTNESTASINLVSAANHVCFITRQYAPLNGSVQSSIRQGCFVGISNGTWQLSRGVTGSPVWCSAHCFKFNP
ncbi:MAG: hypothetical protein AAFS10_20925, partial [Myxococcota bacterium]